MTDQHGPQPHGPAAVPDGPGATAATQVSDRAAPHDQLAGQRRPPDKRGERTDDALTVPVGSIGYVFGEHPPTATVTPGEPVRLRTLDCFGGALLDIHDRPSTCTQWPLVNPVTGPLHILGAKPGDTLAVHIVSLTPAGAHGLSSTSPHIGAPPPPTTPGPAAPEQVWQYDLDPTTATVTFNALTSDYTVDLPYAPSLGTVGVAPAVGTIGTTVPGAHGGALHTPLLCPGTTLYLGVHQPGALLAVGDGHARQGDGASSGAAVETAMDVVLVVDVIDGVSTPVPRMETDTHLLSIGIAAQMYQAYLDGLADLTDLVTGVTGLDPFDAAQLVSQTVQVSLGKNIGPVFTMVAGIDKRHLGLGARYSRVHQNLRAMAADL